MAQEILVFNQNVAKKPFWGSNRLELTHHQVQSRSRPLRQNSEKSGEDQALQLSWAQPRDRLQGKVIKNLNSCHADNKHKQTQAR